MSNDLSRGLFPARDVKLLVVDEAHKAQGEYAYCLVARELARAGAVARVLGLSATPGTDIPSVKAVIQVGPGARHSVYRERPLTEFVHIQDRAAT
jgi:Fanconi anemia group M protein